MIQCFTRYREVLLVENKKKRESTFAERLKMHRELCGYKQWQVADVLNINRTTYTKYETGVSEPSQAILKKIVALFGIDYNALLGKEDVIGANFCDSSLPMFRLTDSENDLVRMFRVMSAENQQELMKIAKQMTSGKRKTEE